MDLFGFKRRRAAKEANARRRAEVLENAQNRHEFPPLGARPLAATSDSPPRRHRPEADAPGSYGGIYPHGSASGMTVDHGTPWAQPDTSGHSHSSHDFGAAGSGLGFDSGSSSSSDSGGSYSGE